MFSDAHIVNFSFLFSFNPHCLTSAETYLLLSETCAQALLHCSPVLFTNSHCLSPFANFHIHWICKKRLQEKKNLYLTSFILQTSLPTDCCSPVKGNAEAQSEAVFTTTDCALYSHYFWFFLQLSLVYNIMLCIMCLNLFLLLLACFHWFSKLYIVVFLEYLCFRNDTESYTH